MMKVLILSRTQAVKRIFLTLAIVAAILVIITIVMGLSIGDATKVDPAIQRSVSNHFLMGVGALFFCLIVHAISLTYFMGTGRWLEETSNAYSLGNSYYESSKKIKYGMLPGLTACVFLLISTAGLGAVADPGTMTELGDPLGFSDAQIHFFFACLTGMINVAVNFTQYIAISKNSVVVEQVLAEVRRIREERGLPVE